MHRFHIAIGTAKPIIDSACVVGAFFLARKIRLVTDLIPSIQLPVPYISVESLFPFALVAAILVVGVFASRGLYHMYTRHDTTETVGVLRAMVWAFLLFIAAVYLTQGHAYATLIPRLIIFFAFLLATFGMLLWRSGLGMLMSYLLARGLLPRWRVLLVGMPEGQLLTALETEHIHTQVLGFTAETPPDDTESLPFSYIGNTKQALKQIRSRAVDEVIMIQAPRSIEHATELFECARIYGVTYRYAPNFFEPWQLNADFVFLGGVPLVEIRSVALGPWNRVIKRGIDIIGSFLGLIVLSPVFALITLLIRLEDPAGPAIYRNIRIGKDGRKFTLYKFRYMRWEYCVKDAYGVAPEKDSALRLEEKLIQERSLRHDALYKIENDPRKTRIGTFIERYSLDELPQLVNVLLGNMSLVGPRPHQPREVERYSEPSRRVLTCKPGITGLAQVSGRHRNTLEDEVRLDIAYMEQWSLWLDIKIILKTFVVAAAGKRD